MALNAQQIEQALALAIEGMSVVNGQLGNLQKNWVPPGPNDRPIIAAQLTTLIGKVNQSVGVLNALLVTVQPVGTPT